MAWEQIKTALQEGRLGDTAKVATQAWEWREGARHVICVYTYNGDDVAHVWRVRQALRDLGFTRKIAWKSDQATYEGQYSDNSGGKQVSRYWG